MRSTLYLFVAMLLAGCWQVVALPLPMADCGRGDITEADQ